jgi:hypothetical protein
MQQPHKMGQGFKQASDMFEGEKIWAGADKRRNNSCQL